MAEEAPQKEVSLLKEAREVLRRIPAADARRTVLAAHIDRLSEAYDLIKTSCARSALRDLVSSATLVMLALGVIATPPDNPPKSGSTEATRFADPVDKCIGVG